MTSIIYLAHKYRQPVTECTKCARWFGIGEVYYTAHFSGGDSPLFSLCAACHKDETSSDKEEQP